MVHVHFFINKNLWTEFAWIRVMCTSKRHIISILMDNYHQLEFLKIVVSRSQTQHPFLNFFFTKFENTKNTNKLRISLIYLNGQTHYSKEMYEYIHINLFLQFSISVLFEVPKLSFLHMYISYVILMFHIRHNLRLTSLHSFSPPLPLHRHAGSMDWTRPTRPTSLMLGNSLSMRNTTWCGAMYSRQHHPHGSTTSTFWQVSQNLSFFTPRSHPSPWLGNVTKGLCVNVCLC